MSGRADSLVAGLIAALLFAALGSLWLLMPSRLLLVCAAVGTVGALSFLATLPLVARGGGRLVSAVAASSLLYVFVAPAGVVLLALRWGVTSPVQLLLVVSLSFVFLYYGLLVPLALYQYRQEDDVRASEPYPSVSVILPAYNEEEVIRRSVAALLEAVYPADRLEIIVVDDGSTDGTDRELRAFADEDGVRIIRKKNGGKYSALNYGLLYADGEVIVTIDADSIVERTALLKLVGALQADPEVGAVAGDVKVSNDRSFLSRLQSLEYVIGINVFRRSLAAFGSVTVVPGALGAYRRDALERTGFYDPDTITEDFDTTIKVLKQGLAVRSSAARTYTQVPGTWRDLYGQRLRWYRGNFTTLLKHRDVFANSRFGVLHQFAFPLTLVSMVFIPVAGVAVLVSIVAGVLTGQGAEIAATFSAFVVLQTLLSLLAVRMDGEDPRLALYAPLFIVGYRQFCDFAMVRSIADALSNREMEWSSPERIASSRPSED